MPKQPSGETNRYKILIEKIFFDHWKKGKTEFEFARDEIKEKAAELKIALPDNVGDIVYSFRYRTTLPQSIIDTQQEGREWIIEGADRSRYRSKPVSLIRIRPREDMVRIAIPD